MTRRVCFDVGGHIFTIRKDLLDAGPASRLTALCKGVDVNENDQKVTIDRPVDLFQAIFTLYQTGELHMPMTSCPGVFLRELEFWGIQPEMLQSCCMYRLQLFLDEQQTLYKFRENVMKEEGKSMLASCMPKLEGIRARIWAIIDFRENSIWAKLYFSIVLTMVLLSIFAIASSTEPIFQRSMTNCERHDFMESAGMENFHLISQLLRDHCEETEIPKPNATRHPIVGAGGWGKTGNYPEDDDYDFINMHQDVWDDDIFESDEPTPSETNPGVPTPGVPTPSVPTPGVPTQGVPTPGVPTQGVPTQGVPTHGVPTQGVPTQGVPTQGVPTQGVPTQGVPTQGVPTPGVPTPGVPTPGVPTQGVPTPGVPTQGVPTPNEPTPNEPNLGVPDPDEPNLGEPDPDEPNLDEPDPDEPNPSEPNLDVTPPSVPNPGETNQDVPNPHESDPDDSDYDTDVKSTTPRIKPKRVKIPNMKVPIFEIVLLEIVTLAFFTVEIVIRLLVCPSILRYFMSVINVVDALTILGAYLHMILINIDKHEKYRNNWMDIFDYMQMLRSVRLFRIVKNLRTSRVLLYSFRMNLADFCVVVVYLLVGICTFSSCVYLIESRKDISSIFDGWYWALITMTTVGYGDIYPMSPWGKLLACLCAISGVLLFALTVPIFATHFLMLYQYAGLEKTFSATKISKRFNESLRNGKNDNMNQPAGAPVESYGNRHPSKTNKM